MDHKLFAKWYVIPNLEDASVIVMDNASYHSRLDRKVPTKNSRKAEILEFMMQHE